MPFKRGFNPREKTCARCGEPFAVAPFRRFRLCPACRAASNLESSAASRKARRRRKAKAGRKAPARNGSGSAAWSGRPWRSRIPPEEALGTLLRACGPEMRAVTAAEYAAALGVGKSTALGILEGLRVLGLASARGRDLEEKPMGRLGTVRWVPRPRGAGAQPHQDSKERGEEAMGKARHLPGPNPEWDGLLSEEEKEFVRKWRWDANLTRLPAGDVRKLVRAAMAFAEELLEDAPAAEGSESDRGPGRKGR